MSKTKLFGKLPETKAVEEVQTETQTTPQIQTVDAVEYKNTAYGIFKDKKTQRLNFVKIKYNGENRRVSSVEVLDESTDRGLIEEQFKMAVVKDIFENPENR